MIKKRQFSTKEAHSIGTQLTALYVLVTEIAKKYFYSRMENAIA